MTNNRPYITAKSIVASTIMDFELTCWKTRINAHLQMTYPQINSVVVYRSTGGTTGTPLRYNISKSDHLLFGALLYRAWGYAGYQLSDKMVFFGGSSILPHNKNKMLSGIQDRARNIVAKLSAFDMSEDNLLSYAQMMNRTKPKFIRGYPSALHFLAQWIEEQDLDIFRPQSIFTTSEKLFQYMRTKIQQIFDAEVYGGYGLNDGGVSAAECEMRRGLHVSTERSILELQSQSDHSSNNEQTVILATNLENYAILLRLVRNTT